MPTTDQQYTEAESTADLGVADLEALLDAIDAADRPEPHAPGCLCYECECTLWAREYGAYPDVLQQA